MQQQTLLKARLSASLPAPPSRYTCTPIATLPTQLPMLAVGVQQLSASPTPLPDPSQTSPVLFAFGSSPSLKLKANLRVRGQSGLHSESLHLLLARPAASSCAPSLPSDLVTCPWEDFLAAPSLHTARFCCGFLGGGGRGGGGYCHSGLDLSQGWSVMLFAY